MDRLRFLAEVSEQTFRDLMSKPWMAEGEDDPHIVEPLVIQSLARIAGRDKDTAERLVIMPFLETIETADWTALQTLSELLSADPDGVLGALALPALEDGITDALAASFPLLYLDFRYPEEASAIRALPWVQDGKPSQAEGDFDIEPMAVATLQQLVVESPQVFWSVLRRPWMQGTQEGFTRGSAQVIDFIRSIARIDGAATLRIVEMPFLESIEVDDENTLETLQALFWADPDGARRLLSHPALFDRTRASMAADVALLYLETQPGVSEAIEALPWVQDGIEPPRDSNVSSIHPTKASLEPSLVLDLTELYLKSPEGFLALVRRPWVREGVDIREYTAIGRLLTVSHRAPAAASRIIGMPFLETLEEEDLIVLEIMEALARNDSDGLRQLLSDPALRGGVTDEQRATVALLHLKQRDTGAAAAIESLPWVRDRMAASEQKPVLVLKELALESQKVFRAVMSRPWLQEAADGLSPDEVTVVANLTTISGKSYAGSGEAAALRLIDMPFLETIGGVDAAAMRALNRLLHQFDQDYLHKVLSHPTMHDGITDDRAVIVAAMGILESGHTALLDTLLDPEQVYVEERVVQLPHTGEVSLSVIHVNPGTYRTMDILEQLLRSQEGFMGTPFPTSYVGLLVADATPAAGGGGPGGVFTVDPGYEEDRYLIAHELAHTYWPFSPRWIAEGGAEFMTTISADKQFSSNECSVADSLSELQRLGQERLEQGLSDGDISPCYYTLGRGLFLDLYDTLIEDAFREGFRKLYLKMRDEEHFGECTGLERGICYVRAAFVADASPESAALAGPVITRWYEGPVP